MRIGNEVRSVLELEEEAASTNEKQGGSMVIENMAIQKSVKKAEKQHKKQMQKELVGEGAKPEESSEEQHEAALKIQGAVRTRSAKKKMSRMRSWQAKTLRAFESDRATILIVLLVCIDIALTVYKGTSGEFINIVFSYFCTAFFFLELCLRFHCYAFMSRGEG